MEGNFAQQTWHLWILATFSSLHGEPSTGDKKKALGGEKGYI